MKYRDLKLTFTLEGTEFNTVSICLEKLEQPMPLHSHSKNSYEIHYISAGFGTLTTDNGRYEITPGTLFVTGPQIAHEQVSSTENPMVEYCLYMKVYPADQGKHALTDQFCAHPFWIGTGDTQTHELMKQLISELETRNAGYEQMLEALLQQFILHLIRKYSVSGAEGSPSAAPKLPTEDLSYLLIEEAFLYNYRDITLESLASQVGLGIRQTERLLQVHYRKTFQQKKTEARMSAATSLLRDTDYSVSAIAEQLGYSSPEHFSHAFKAACHMTPSAFRKQKRS